MLGPVPDIILSASRPNHRAAIVSRSLVAPRLTTFPAASKKKSRDDAQSATPVIIGVSRTRVFPQAAEIRTVLDELAGGIDVFDLRRPEPPTRPLPCLHP
jgi:hypothetical protein